MKIVDNQKLLKESKLEQEVDSLLEELGDAAAQPEGAVVDKEPELEKVEGTVSSVEKELEAEHAEEAEEVSEVEIKESADGDAAAKPEGAVVDAEPELEKVEATASAVEKDLEADHAEEAEEVSEVVVKEEEELEKADDEEKADKELLLEPASEEASEDGEKELEKAETKEDSEKEDDKEEESEKKEDEDKPAEEKKDDDKEETEKVVDESFSPLFKLLAALNEEVEGLGSAAAKPEGAVVDKAPEEEKVEGTVKAVEGDLEAEHAEKAEEVSEVEIKESADGSAAAKPEDVTVEKEPETKAADSVASAVESDLNDEHAATVEDVVEVVVEAARRAKANGRALKEDIARELKALLEEEGADVTDLMGVGKTFADKEYDEDAAENSAEMNGSEKAFDDYKDVQGDGADAALSGQLKPEDLREDADGSAAAEVKATEDGKPEEINVDKAAKEAEEHNECGEESAEEVQEVEIKESVSYKSLKEACMLDEDYFSTDTYTVDTAESKRAKLTEQVSLLMAREALDPMYDELLKTSLYAQRLQEALVNKYGASASKKVSVITESERDEQAQQDELARFNDPKHRFFKDGKPVDEEKKDDKEDK